MSAQMIVHPPSKDGSMVSHEDDIPPQPLDQDEHEPGHKAGLGIPQNGEPAAVDDSPQFPDTIGSRHQGKEAFAFHKLPIQVLERILWMVDANSFASLAILNKNWYKAAQNRELYAHHLSRCPSYALSNTVITGPFRKFDLYRLKTKFAAEVRRNLFEAYLRPRQTLINLISVNASSSAALPGAEAFRFSFSPNGQTILAISSSRIYVIDAVTDPISVRHELKTMRRPLAASVTDDGTILAVLSSKHQANVYHLTPDGVKHVQVQVMDNPPRTIALAPEGTVLAAAYEGGVEVFSLAPNALSTDRRAVRSEGVDILSFSGDGSMLVGSTQSLEEPSAVVITAPFYTENDLSPKEVHSRMWTTQILFPQISSICSHAELLQGHTEGDANWLFAYDHTLMSYRAVRTDDTRTGVAYFLNPATSRRFSLPAPSTAPTATVCGTLVVAGFAGSGLWMYGVPEKLDVSPDMGSVVERHEQRLQGRMPLTSATGHLEPLMAYSPSISGSSEDIEDDSLAAKVEWRESLFVKCERIKTLDGATAAKWVERCEDRPCSFTGKRLVVVAPGGVDQFMEELGDETMPIDGSRLSILDFDYSPSKSADRELTIEVGEKEPELLIERMGDMDIEVAMERRRTVRERARGGMRGGLGRSVTTASATPGSRLRSVSQASSPLDVDAQIALANSTPAPVQQASPNLQRSATAAGFTTARYPPRPPLAQQQDAANAAYHQPPGQLSDGWESPPPPYNSGSPHLRPGMTLGSPLIQPRPMGGMPMPMVGIPENGHAPEVHPGFGHGSPMNPQITPQQVHMMPENAAPRHVVGQYGTPVTMNDQSFAPTPETYQRTSPISHIASANAPFVPSASGDSSRPVSHEGRVSPYQQTPTSQRPNTSDRPSPLNPTQQMPNFSDMAPIHKPSSSGSVTLTGANLQARLNHPVPPTPSPLDQMYLPQTNEAVHELVSPQSAQSPAIQANGSYSVVPPTADQMANLNRRVSLTARKPVPPIATHGAMHQNGPARDLSGSPGVPPSPPRGAWGAAGVPGSPSFNKAINQPNGLMRNNSKGSGRSIPISASTPNLHAAPPVQTQRPRMGRLDTIDSVSSSYGPGEPGSRSHSVAQGMVAPMPQPQQNPHFISQTQSVPQQVYQQMPTHQTRVWAGNGPSPAESGNRRALSDPMSVESGKKKKGKRKKGEEVPRSQTPMPTSSRGAEQGGGVKKKGGRCVVM
ncbi:uncharacterized protein Z520_02070 [Fonsecaea multimorphosa CBS 102226]|uniref:F-box domain-containing protein n=1 Tax=Fonsecaea multimorphosa CBS 102226 TaxID=1442371 RepID=A0A0D2IY43_9EURO|nr:uncharacterized protein Z520_02070 [Fonsecaea multimorphosa CBS 102226]KIY01932.1 hypothetical protein Z520_02070 [Fonsecaea multimorphosa CBS 102226]OAL29615.1 hypothetical protein AYO22_02029 [Fonsecaea multimorphosa]